MNNKACQNSWNEDYLKLIKYLGKSITRVYFCRQQQQQQYKLIIIYLYFQIYRHVFLFFFRKFLKS